MLNLGTSYFVFFSLIGIFLPYFNLYCRSIGFSPAQIGFFMAAFASLKCVSPILWGRFADRTGRRKELLVLSGWGSFVIFSGFFLTHEFMPMLVLIVLFGFFRSPLMPMVEATTWEQIPIRGWEYGKIRLWGSVGFIVSTLSIGYLSERYSVGLILQIMFGLLILQAILLHRFNVSPSRHHQEHGSIRSLFAKAHLNLFFLTGFLTQVSHGMFYSLFSIHLKDFAFHESAVGLCWTVSIVCEVVLMGNYERWFGKVPPMKIVALAAMASTLRWFTLSRFTYFGIILATQSLHAFTFAACHIASLKYLNENTPPNLKTTGQSLYSSIAFGMGIMAGSALAGIIYQRWGGLTMFRTASLIAVFSLVAATVHLALFSKKHAVS